MYKDDIKLFVKNEKELESLIKTVRFYFQDKGMEFGIGKCAMLVMKSIKGPMKEGVKLPNQIVIRTSAKKKPTPPWGSWKINTIKQEEI